MEIMKEETTSLGVGGHPVGTRRSVSQGFRKKKKTANVVSKSQAAGSDKEVRSSTEFHEPLNFLITILLAVLGLSFRGSGISPLIEHDAIMLFFIMVVAMYDVALLGMKLGSKNANYLPMLKFVCVICAIIACELLASILIDPLKLLIINLCGILVELIRRTYKQILELLCHPFNELLNLLQKSFQSLCHISNWIQHKTKEFNKFTLFGSSTEKQDQDEGGQIADIV